MRVYLLYPSGNLTALVDIKPGSQKLKQEIEHKIYQQFPKVEQVGFIYSEGNKNILEMTGNEMCINACLCYFKLLTSKSKKNKTILVKGPDCTIECSENSNSSITISPPDIQSKDIEYRSDENICIVEMPGITHIFIYDEALEHTDVIKRYIISGKAVGITLIGEKKEINYLKTKIYLPHLGIFREETSCGSGTVAYGALIAKKNGSVSQKVIHPSGLEHNIEGIRKDNGNISLHLSSIVEILEIYDL